MITIGANRFNKSLRIYWPFTVGLHLPSWWNSSIARNVSTLLPDCIAHWMK